MHEPFMHRCLQLAEQARGKTGINPMVGAVLVRDGVVIAEGYHKGYGMPHAELDLMQNVEQKISSSFDGAQDDTVRDDDILYVNLEPCCHTNKQTPPCAQMLLERGVKHVVYGMIDPNPGVAGKGLALLREAGVTVTGPVLRAECEWLNRGFISLMRRQRPWITVKKAKTQAGEIARSDGAPLKITTGEQDVWSHTWLRAKHDAILVGVETVLRDDPLLNTRFVQNKKVDQFSPIRIILDPSLRISVSSKILHDFSAKTIVCVSPSALAAGSAKALLLNKTAVLLPVATDANGRFAWQALWDALTLPSGDFAGITSVLVEGGARTWSHFIDARICDAEVTLVGAGVQ